jgi:hypothetical protein
MERIEIRGLNFLVYRPLVTLFVTFKRGSSGKVGDGIAAVNGGELGKYSPFESCNERLGVSSFVEVEQEDGSPRVIGTGCWELVER